MRTDEHSNLRPLSPFAAVPSGSSTSTGSVDIQAGYYQVGTSQTGQKVRSGRGMHSRHIHPGPSLGFVATNMLRGGIRFLRYCVKKKKKKKKTRHNYGAEMTHENSTVDISGRKLVQ
jgi:hypothetical protein